MEILDIYKWSKKKAGTTLYIAYMCVSISAINNNVVFNYRVMCVMMKPKK